ncbi:MAG: AEC family transporter [Cyanobacteria bacterium P01_H01_bin.15]
MSAIAPELLGLYTKLGSGITLGWFLGRALPQKIPFYLGLFLFWVGVPISIVAFFRKADLSGGVWVATLLSLSMTATACGIAWLFWQQWPGENKSPRIQGSFLLASMVGNTGYLGYPIVLTLAPESFFGWAVFYDLGSILGSYGFGVLLASHYSSHSSTVRSCIKNILSTPALWAMGMGLWFRQIPLPTLLEDNLLNFAWATLVASLVLIGMRISQIRSWGHLPLAATGLSIKMLILPLILGFLLKFLGMASSPLLVMVLQKGMPPAFATLVISEAYGLDQELSVTALTTGVILLLLTLPIWLWLFN